MGVKRFKQAQNRNDNMYRSLHGSPRHSIHN